MVPVLVPIEVLSYCVRPVSLSVRLFVNMMAGHAMMDVFVLPSHREGFPRSCMEASAMGVPCVVTDIRGCREAVVPGRNGLLVPLGDVPALAGAIIELLTDRDRAARMGVEGRQLAAERFDARQVFEKVRCEYERLLRKKGLPVPEPRPAAAVTSVERQPGLPGRAPVAVK